MDIRITFGSRLKELRIEKELSYAILAKELNVSSVSLGYYERGERLPDIEMLSRMAKYFDVSCDYLVGLNNNRQTQNINIENILGLSDKTIFFLKQLKEEPEMMKIFNDIITADLFYTLLYKINEYSKHINSLNEYHKNKKFILDISNTDRKKEIHKLKNRLQNLYGGHVEFLDYDQSILYYIQQITQIINVLIIELYPEQEYDYKGNETDSFLVDGDIGYRYKKLYGSIWRWDVVDNKQEVNNDGNDNET